MVGKAVHHVSLNVTDVPACVAFYEALGFHTIDRPDFGFGGAWMRIGDAGELHLLGFPPPEPVGQHFAIHVDDLGDAPDRVRYRSGRLAQPINNHHLPGPVGREPLAQRLADTASPAGDNTDPILNPHGSP